MEQADIAGIRERLEDLLETLRAAEAPAVAAHLQRIAADFTHVTGVRRAVSCLTEQLASWREEPGSLPNSAAVLVAASRLEDACRAALQQGVIVPAKVPLSVRVRGLLRLVLAAAAVGGLLATLPFALVAAGIDLGDLRPLPDRSPVALVKGRTRSLVVAIAAMPERPARTSRALIGPADGCARAVSQGGCRAVGLMSWPDGALQTYEQRLPNQAYGLRFAVAEQPYAEGARGTGELWVEALPETPTGRYRIALSGAYVGYQPDCPWWRRAFGQCASPAGQPSADGARPPADQHGDLAVPAAVIEVREPTADERRQAAREAARERQRASEQAVARAALIAESAAVVNAELDRVERLWKRRKYEQAKAGFGKLQQQLSPLDAVAAAQRAAVADVPDGVVSVRHRFAALRQVVTAFEAAVFDAAFKALHPFGEHAASAPGEGPSSHSRRRARARIVRRFRISDAYLDRILDAHAGQVEERLASKAEARKRAARAQQQAQKQRCGALPLDAFRRIERYLTTRHGAADRVVMQECASPRLSASNCWQVHCDYRLERYETGHKRVRRMRAAFRLRDGRVVGHGDPG